MQSLIVEDGDRRTRIPDTGARERNATGNDPVGRGVFSLVAIKQCAGSLTTERISRERHNLIEEAVEKAKLLGELTPTSQVVCIFETSFLHHSCKKINSPETHGHA